MTRPDRKANRAALARLQEHLAEGTNGGEPREDEIPVSDTTRVAIDAMKALYAQQTQVHQQNLNTILAAAAKDEKIDLTKYNFLDIDKYVWRKKT